MDRRAALKTLAAAALAPVVDLRPTVKREAYPWGERANHPYKAWCAEVRDQLRGYRLPVRPVSAPRVDPRQGQLFDGGEC